jgi:hypothetical protein
MVVNPKSLWDFSILTEMVFFLCWLAGIYDIGYDRVISKRAKM